MLPEPLEQRRLDLGDRRHAAERLAGDDALRASSRSRRASFSTGTRSASIMRSGSKSASSVPWKKSVRPSITPPVPQSLRAPTSMSLRGRNSALTPSRRSPDAAAAQMRAAIDARSPGSRVRSSQLPAHLAFVEIEAAAAGDAPPDVDAVARAVLEAHLVGEDLVQADERGGTEAQKTYRLGDASRVVRLDQRLVEGDVLASAAEPGVDDADGTRGHG